MAEQAPWDTPEPEPEKAPWDMPAPEPTLLERGTKLAADFGAGAAETAGKAVSNLGPSALQFGKDLVQPAIHPIDTAESMKNLGLGVLEKISPWADYLPAQIKAPIKAMVAAGGGDHEKYADAVGKFMMDRYGSLEKARKTLETDPVGMASDLSMFLTGGGTAAAKVPGMVGKVGKAAEIAGKVIDPIGVPLQAAKTAGRAVPWVIGNLGTHTGAEPLRAAASAGYEGGEAAKAFRENMRKQAPMEETVEAARVGLDNMVQKRGSSYREAIKEIGADTKVLDFNKIDQAVQNVSGVKVFKGVDLSPSTAKLRQEITGAIEDWRAKDPAEYHTAIGLDALKQKIGDMVYGSTESGTPARVVGENIYRSIGNTISTANPKYGKIMRAYEKATLELKEIEKTLSLPGDHKATIDTSLRKLQSALRDNVNTSFGRRRELAQYLVEAGSPQLMERLAGQALQPGAPRGIGRLGMQLGMEMLILAGGAVHSGIGIAALAPAIAALPFMSPRAMGEAHYYAGRAASPARMAKDLGVKPRPRLSYQMGRASRVENEGQP